MTKELVSYLEQRAGSHLREVAVYDENSWEITYLRDDLDTQMVQERIKKIYRAIEVGLGPHGLDDEIGERHATLQVRKDAVLLNLPWDKSAGSFVGLDPEAASQLTGFITECLQHRSRPSNHLPPLSNTY